MGALSIWHILIIAIVLVLLFGRGKISDIMGDTAKGIRQFRKGLADPDEPPAKTPAEPANKDTTHS
jgi:sec-independent protein translocase protein TatA